MPTIAVDVTPEVADALGRQARGLLMARRAYIRAVLAAVAEQARSGSVPEQPVALSSAVPADHPRG